MRNLIFLDFAETLGYRIKPEIETDLCILRELIPQSDLTDEKYHEFVQKNNIYNRFLSFHSLDEEKNYTKKFFFEVISTITNNELANDLADKVTEKKFSTLCHALYPEVQTTLLSYQNVADMYMLSDGPPSRKLTLQQLGLGKFCRDFFISDEIGVTKNNTDFYHRVLKITGPSSKITFIDDQLENLDTLAKITLIQGFYVDRHQADQSYSGKYVHVNELPDAMSFK